MKVKELIEWLSAFEDQDAEVEIVRHTRSSGYYDQGGNASVEAFDPGKHIDYTDLRGNPHIAPGTPSYNSRTLLLGEIDGY